MRKRTVLMVLGVLTILATPLGIAALDAYAERPPKLVVRQSFGPFGVEPGQTVHLAAFNPLPGAGGELTFTVLDGVAGDLHDQATLILDPRSGENFTITISNPGILLAVVRFESGDVSALRGPALATSVQVVDAGLGTRLFATAEVPSPEQRGDRSRLPRQAFYGPFLAAPGDWVRLSAFNHLPQPGGRVTFTLVDGITGDLVDEARYDLEPLSGEAATFHLDDPWLMGIVRFESGDLSSARGPVLASSMEVLGPGLETRYGDIDNDGDHD